jgi:hypothetical protein
MGISLPKFAWTALAASAALALSLTACGGANNTVSSGAASAAAPAAAETSAAPKLSGTFADTITFPSGVAVTVKPAVVPAAQYAAGAVEGKIVTFDITVTNGGKESVNGAMMSYPNVSYGAQGTKAQNATDVQAGIGASSFSTILPGETSTVKVGYGIPAAGFADVRVEIAAPNMMDKPAIFKGAVG